MQAWWRVLRGIKPYMLGAVISVLCALGVGLSYASGVAVLIPVMKIFVSYEGIHGWANRDGAEKRFHLEFEDLNFNQDRHNARPEFNVDHLVIRSIGPDTVAELGKVSPGDAITEVTATVGGRTRTSKGWMEMLDILATTPRGNTVDLTIQPEGPEGADAPRHVHFANNFPMLHWYTETFVKIVSHLPADKFYALCWVVGFFVFLCIFGSVLRYYQQFLGMTIANRVVMDLRRRTYDRVVQLPTSYFAQKGTNDILSRLTQDTNTLTEGVSMAMGKAIQEPVKAAGAFILAMVIDWRLCLLIILSMPILGIIIRKFSKRMRKASRRALENWSSMLAVINETLVGARVVKAYSAEGYERRRFARVNRALLKEQIRLNHYASLSRPTIEFLSVSLSAIPMLIASRLVIQGSVTLESFVTLLACFAAMFEPLRKLSDVNGKVQQSNAAATRVFEIADMAPEPNHDYKLPKLPRHGKSIEFKDVSFKYPGHEEMVLKNVSFTIHFGANVAVVGGNGSGKTTLLSLLPMLYQPTSGQIFIDGVDITKVSVRSLRKQIGLVTQDTILFADSVYSNIAYGTRHSTEAQVMDASRRAFADEFIRNMPEGYKTLVGENGVRLSGGQKQRIAIARAILHDPAILILDEAMSQIDADSESKINDALREFTRGRTTLSIAHRFSTIIAADLIVCLDKGEFAGMGVHRDLLVTCAPYRKLYETQFRDLTENAPAEPAAAG
jgi:ABC-type multidrug transport system fused ATPase/permease subunit